MSLQYILEPEEAAAEIAAWEDEQCDYEALLDKEDFRLVPVETITTVDEFGNTYTQRKAS
jgi:hypothetical protein